MREMTENATEEELAAMRALVEQRFAKEVAARNEPWTPLPGESESEKKRRYLTGYVFSSLLIWPSLTSLCSQVDSLAETVQTALDEIKKCTNFNAYVIIGGPAPSGTGAISLQAYVPYMHSFVASLLTQPPRLQSGHSLDSGQSFDDFLGPMHQEIKDRFVDWLHTAYSE